MELAYDNKADVMRWMIDGQLGRRNLTPVQRITIAKKYEGKFKEEAKENYEKNVGRPTNDLRDNHPPIGGQLNIKIDTSKEIAKLANVGVGTLARYDVVMKSDNEDVKTKMLKDEITINNAYDQIRPKPELQSEKPLPTPVTPKVKQEEPAKPTTNKCLKCKQVKPISEFKDESDFCNIQLSPN